jgi:hypothetical protein
MAQIGDPLDVAKASDRRDSTRVGFGAAVGFSDSGETENPATATFYRVTAQDLSHSGLSFNSDRWPRRESLILMLGTVDNPVYVNARIVRCVTEGESDDAPSFVVHCEFTDWVG